MENIVCQGTLPKISDHDGIIVCFNTKSLKTKTRTRTFYDYNNADEVGLINYIKNFDFENTVFNQATMRQADVFTNILQDALAKFEQRHLGLYLSSTLDWTKQISEVCLKANRKLAVLRSVKLLSRQTLDMLYKLTVRSLIDYALPVYCLL